MIKCKGWEISSITWLLMEGTRLFTSETKTIQQELYHFWNQNYSAGRENQK